MTRILSHMPLGLLGRIGEQFPDAEVVQVPEEGPLDDDVAGEVLLTNAWGAPNLAEVVARGVRWVHTYGTGVNDFPFEALGDRPAVSEVLLRSVAGSTGDLSVRGEAWVEEEALPELGCTSIVSEPVGRIGRNGGERREPGRTSSDQRLVRILCGDDPQNEEPGEAHSTSRANCARSVTGPRVTSRCNSQ